MVYQGSKNKLAKYLKPIIESYLKPDMSYVEPFVGGANLIDKIKWDKKVGYDINPYLIALHNQAQHFTLSVIDVSKDLYYNVKEHKQQYEKWFVGYVGFLCSYGGAFFNGYSFKTSKRNYIEERLNNLTKQSQSMYYKNIQFECADFKDLNITNSVIYLDPPYKGTKSYNTGMKFNHNELWEKCKYWNQYNNIILLSEIEAPDDKWKCIWEKTKTHSHLCYTKKDNTKNVIEKLFIYIGE